MSRSVHVGIGVSRLKSDIRNLLVRHRQQLLLLLALAGLLWASSRLSRLRHQRVRAREAALSRARYNDSAIPTEVPTLRRISLLTSAYKGEYSDARQVELALVAHRNQHLSAVARYHRLLEYGVRLSPAPRASGRSLARGEHVTYRALFSEAQTLGGVVVLANADIYFDESLRCVSLLAPRTVLALSRHPSPDCFLASARGDKDTEPDDFCAGYHPQRAASHDVFVFAPPVPKGFLEALGDLRVNQMGAENVVIYLLKEAGYRVVNPCVNVHAFHQHCTGERASTAKASAKHISLRSEHFGATTEFGYVHGSVWMSKEFAWKHGGVDCLAFGLSAADARDAGELNDGRPV